MYVLLYPFGGFNDILKLIDYVHQYCKHYDRTLLVPTLDHYRIYTSEIFNINHDSIILDASYIYSLLDSSSTTIYPNCITRMDISNIIHPESRENIIRGGKIHYTFQKTNTKLKLPNTKCSENIIFFSHHGCFPGNSFRIFSEFTIHHHKLKHNIFMRYNDIPKPYLCIQVRGCDKKAIWVSYYNLHKTYIHSFNHIYLCTDDIKVLEFYKNEGLPIYNFTTYPNTSYGALHMSDISGYIKMLDLISDLYIASKADAFLSNSRGGYIHLMRECMKHKHIIHDMIHK